MSHQIQRVMGPNQPITSIASTLSMIRTIQKVYSAPNQKRCHIAQDEKWHHLVDIDGIRYLDGKVHGKAPEPTHGG